MEHFAVLKTYMAFAHPTNVCKLDSAWRLGLAYTQATYHFKKRQPLQSKPINHVYLQIIDWINNLAKKCGNSPVSLTFPTYRSDWHATLSTDTFNIMKTLSLQTPKKLDTITGQMSW
jgi:hypothetical protein